MNISQTTNPSLNNGTSFHGHMFYATPQRLIEAFGPAEYVCNGGEDKVNFEWILKLSDPETEDERIFTIYDWKEYRRLSMDEEIEWHIGAHNSYGSLLAQSAIINALAPNAIPSTINFLI
jgi:hypothetical protein